jgi:phosphate transport system substrate-binding protein
MPIQARRPESLGFRGRRRWSALATSCRCAPHQPQAHGRKTITMVRPICVSAFVLSLCLSTVSCGGGSSAASAPAADLHGAGASFPAPLYDRWFKDYVRSHPNVRVDYQSVGSGAGITQFTNKTVDFGASDAAMTDEEIAKIDKGVQLIPLTAGSIVLSYNLPDLKAPLKLSRDAYAGIFLGKITKWSDPIIASANAGVTLPDLAIAVVHRADSSGTTFVFTQHLSAISAEWKSGPGTSKSPNWPTGIGAKGNEGVTSTVTQTPGAIGYVEFGYAKLSKLPMASLQNKAGSYVEANTSSAQAALAGTTLPENLRAFLPDPDGNDAYPIVTYTWLLAYKKYDNEKTSAALKDVVRYCLNDGQKVSEEMGYVPLPQPVVAANLKALDNIN